MQAYTIVAGDTLWALSQRFGCTVSELMAANPGVIPEQLQIGQILNIPGSQRIAPNNPIPSGSLLLVGRGPRHTRLDSTLSDKAPSPIRELRNMINSAAQATNIPADLIGAVIYQESGGQINVNPTINQGNSGLDSGLMQVNQYTAAELQQKYPHRFSGLSGTAKDVMLGASYLKDMYDTIGKHDWGITLRAYNSGPYGVDENNLRNLPKGTGDKTYVDKVLHFWEDISQGNSLPPDHYESVYGRGF